MLFDRGYDVAALKERAIALDRKQQAQDEKHAAVRGAMTHIVNEIEKEAAAGARAGADRVRN